MTEEIAGQSTLPAEFPAPILTCNMLIEREITDALRQQERWDNAFNESMKFAAGDKTDAAMAAKYKSAMHLQAYIGSVTVADLLRTIQGMAPGLADQIANDFDQLHESGESGELLWEWATERGLDPEAITEATKAKLAGQTE